MTMSKELIIVLFCVFVGGVFVGYKIKSNTSSQEVANVQSNQVVSTAVSYTPKQIDPITKEPEKTDIEAKINPAELNIRVNGHDQVITKADDEKYLFEKNKVLLEQTSKADINITIPDLSRKWGIGADFIYDLRVGQGLRYGGVLEYNLFQFLSINAGVGQGYVKTGALIRF